MKLQLFKRSGFGTLGDCVEHSSRQRLNKEETTVTVEEVDQVLETIALPRYPSGSKVRTGCPKTKPIDVT